MTAKRAVIRLQLDIAAKQALDKLCERRGMTQIAVLSRLVKWFANQDEIVAESGSVGFEAPEEIRTDRVEFRGTTLPYLKEPRNPGRF